MTKGLIHDVLKSISQRMDFTPGKYLMQRHALPVSIGWDSTIQRASIAASTRPNLTEIQKSLIQSFIEHTLVGEKLVLYYGFSGLSADDKAAHGVSVQKAPTHISIPNTEFKNVYPLAIYDRDALKVHEADAATLTAIFHENERTYFLFSSIRSFNERVSIDASMFSQEDRDQLSDYSELIGVRAIRRQCFDYVVYDAKRELVELRIDCPDGTPTPQKQAATQQLIAAFNQLAVFGSGWSPFGTVPMNFHTLMNALYKTGKEGSVFQLGFTASTETTSSNNGAKLLRKKNVDLRKDQFHVGGAREVKDISPYTIGVEWQSEIVVSRPKVIVPGSVRMLYNPPITFPELFIRGCLTTRQYEYLTEKIDKYR